MRSQAAGEICCEDSASSMVAMAWKDMAERGGRETILLVEDEDFTRGAVRSALEAAGYQVVAVETGAEAKASHRRFSHVIDLLLSDVVMPGMSGPELAKDLLALTPGIRVLLMSGYAEQMMRGANHGEGWCRGLECMAKPFSVATLLKRVRGALDGRALDRPPMQPRRGLDSRFGSFV